MLDPTPGQFLLVDPSAGYLGVRHLNSDRVEVWARTFDPDDPGSRGQATRHHVAEFVEALRRWPGSGMGAAPLHPELAAGGVRVAVDGRSPIAFSIHRPGAPNPSFVISVPQQRLPAVAARLASV